MSDFQNFSHAQNMSKSSNFLSDMQFGQFGKIFNNNNNIAQQSSKPQQFATIDELFANTLVPISDVKVL